MKSTLLLFILLTACYSLAIPQDNAQPYKDSLCKYLENKQFDEALEMTEKALELSKEDLAAMNEILELKIMILNSQKDVELNKIFSERNRIRIYFIILAVCFFFVVLLGTFLYYYKFSTKKNIAFFRQIKEKDDLAEKHNQANEIDRTNDFYNGQRQQQQLVMRFCEYLKSERNFANRNLNLDEIVSKLATNRTYLFEAVKTITEKTPLDYIRFLQLEEAKLMLETHLEFNIETVAESCGFNSRSTFYRLFREQYKINPTEFRKLALKQKAYK